MIELRHIDVALPHGSSEASTILEQVSVRIADGEWIVLAGANGSGKTTLLKVIAGLVPIASGELDMTAAERNGLSLLLQEPDNQFVTSSVRGELLLSLPMAVEEPVVTSRLSTAVDMFGLDRFLDRNPHDLSGGEKQRLALATVWLSDPRVLLLDEPTAYLDSVERDRVVRFVDGLNQQGVAVVWATPSDEDVPGRHRVVVLDGGRVVFDGYDAPTTNEVELPKTAPRQSPLGEHSVVRLDSVGFAYPAQRVFSDFSLDVIDGECLAIAGRNGSGKSTLLGLLSGILKPTSGHAEYRYPKAVTNGRQHLFYLFQNPERLFFAETVLDEIAFGLKTLSVQKSEIEERVHQALDDVGLPPDDFAGRLPFSLSPGEMRRLAFAIALAIDPQCLFMDEPGSCLDKEGRRLLFDVIDRFRNRGRTVVFASHNIEVFSPLADRIIEL